MAERVRFFGTNDADIFELRRISRSGEEIQLRATLKWHWLPKRWRQLTVKAAELEALADWAITSGMKYRRWKSPVVL
jgi:hypothetical protein